MFPKKTARGKKTFPGSRRSLEDMDFWSLVKILDAETSYRVRTDAAIAAGLGGLIPCYTCGQYHHFKDMDCGHMIIRKFFGTRWKREILRPQCTSCNLYHEGRHTEFRKRLVSEIGEARMQTLEQYAQVYGHTHPDRLLLIEQIQELRKENNRRRKEEPWRT